MKIGISSTGQDLESDIDMRFGRCPYFLIIDIKEGAITATKSIENTQADRKSATGPAVAQLIADQNVDGILTGNIGPRALSVLQQFSIPVYEAHGSKRDGIQQFIQGKCPIFSEVT